MSRGLICNQCGTVLVVDSKGDDEYGESAAWLRLAAADSSFDLCTRACAVELLTSPEFVTATDAYAESIASLARSIRDAREDGDDGES